MEAFEHQYPVRIKKYESVPAPVAMASIRAAYGIVRAFEFLTRGGDHPFRAAAARWALRIVWRQTREAPAGIRFSATAGRAIAAMAQLAWRRGVLEIESPGGGGFSAGRLR